MFQSNIIRYQASTPDAKYSGFTLWALTQNVRSEVMQPILEKFNVEQLDPNGWINAQLELDIMREIEARHTFEEMVAIGVKSGEDYPIPPTITRMHEFLDVAGTMWQMMAQNVAPEETVSVEKLEDRYYRCIYNLPVPPFVLYGGTYGVLKRLRQPTENFTIYVVDSETPYIFDIKW